MASLVTACLAFQAPNFPRSAVMTPRTAYSPVAVDVAAIDQTTLQYIGGAVVLAGGAYAYSTSQTDESPSSPVAASKTMTSTKNWPRVGGTGGPHRMA